MLTHTMLLNLDYTPNLIWQFRVKGILKGVDPPYSTSASILQYNGLHRNVNNVTAF